MLGVDLPSPDTLLQPQLTISNEKSESTDIELSNLTSTASTNPPSLPVPTPTPPPQKHPVSILKKPSVRFNPSSLRPGDGDRSMGDQSIILEKRLRIDKSNVEGTKWWFPIPLWHRALMSDWLVIFMMMGFVAILKYANVPHTKRFIPGSVFSFSFLPLFLLLC